jgi:hypothetical protein
LRSRRDSERRRQVAQPNTAGVLAEASRSRRDSKRRRTAQRFEAFRSLVCSLPFLLF